MGCSIRVNWTDGPTQRAVADILRVMNHKGFDGMTDSSYYHPPLLWRGALVTFGADSIRCSRAESADLLREASHKVSAATGLPLLEVTEGAYPAYVGGNMVVPYRWHPDGVVVSDRDGCQWHSQICESLVLTLSKCATADGVEVPRVAPVRGQYGEVVSHG
jgi:hypothetical protein